MAKGATFAANRLYDHEDGASSRETVHTLSTVDEVRVEVFKKLPRFFLKHLGHFDVEEANCAGMKNGLDLREWVGDYRV